jgi:hypothetical protein
LEIFVARSLKTKGVEEVRLLKRRVIRQHSLSRISKKDRDALVDLLDKFEARVVCMSEETDGEEW